MRSVISKNSLAALFSCYCSMALSQVDVVDRASVSAINASATAIAQQIELTGSTGSRATVEAINNSGERLGKINDTLVKIIADIARRTKKIDHAKMNAELYNPGSGAKPNSSCGIFRSVTARASGEEVQELVESKMAVMGNQLINRGVYLPDDFDLAQNASLSVINAEKSEAAYVEANGPISLSGDEGFDNDASNEAAWSIVHRKTFSMAVPSPIEQISESELLSASPNVAMRLIQKDRHRYIEEMLRSDSADRSRTYSASWLDSFVYTGGSGEKVGIPAHLLEGIGAELSKTEVSEILNTYRMQNPNWVSTTITKANEVGLMRDNNIMNAQALELLHSLNSNSKSIKQLLTLIYASQIEKSGVPQITRNRSLKNSQR